MSNAIIFRARTPASIAAVAAALICVPVTGFAQTASTAPRPVQAPARPKPAPQAPAVQAGVQPATQGVASGKTPDDIIARVGDANLSADDIRSYIAALGPREQAAVAQDPALLSQAVRMMLANRLVLQEVVAKKWDQQPGVAAQLDRIRENALVELYLQAASMPPASFPSDDELQKTYDANRDALLMPRQFQLAQIFVTMPKDADRTTEDKAKKAVDDIQRKLKVSGADFATIANENDGKNGGDLGWVAENQIRPEIRAEVMGLAKSAVSEPIRLDDGWHILKLVDTKASYTRTLPEVREQLVQQMRAERAKMLRQAYLGELIKRNPPVLNEIALSKVLSEQTRATR
jgi:peptidylprolyl isomerase